MKLSLLSLASVSSALVIRDLALIQGILDQTGADLAALQKAAEDFNGDPKPLTDTADAFIAHLVDAKPKVDASEVLNFDDTLAVAPSVVALQDAGTKLRDEFKTRLGDVEKANQCDAVRERLSKLSVDSEALIKSIIQKVDPSAQGIAETLAQPLIDTLNGAVEDYKSCTNSGPTEPTTTTTSEAPPTDTTTTEAPPTDTTTSEAPPTDTTTSEAPPTDTTTSEAPPTDTTTTEAPPTDTTTEVPPTDTTTGAPPTDTDTVSCPTETETTAGPTGTETGTETAGPTGTETVTETHTGPGTQVTTLVTTITKGHCPVCTGGGGDNGNGGNGGDNGNGGNGGNGGGDNGNGGNGGGDNGNGGNGGGDNGNGGNGGSGGDNGSGGNGGGDTGSGGNGGSDNGNGGNGGSGDNGGNGAEPTGPPIVTAGASLFAPAMTLALALAAIAVL